MNPAWQEFLGASGARINTGVLSDFGDLAAELLAGRDGTVVSPLAHLGLLECEGDEARSFLHNQLTSDVNHMSPELAQHSSWCSAKGRMLASLLLYWQNNAVQLLISEDLLESSLKRLQMFILRSRVKLSNRSDERAILGLSGAQAELALQAVGMPVPDIDLAARAFAGGVVVRLRKTQFLLILDIEQAQTAWPLLTGVAKPVSPKVWQWLEIQAGAPLITAATREAFVPQMANLDKIGGVSFRKGCYPGQEVIARTQYLGKIKRHLYLIHASDEFSSGTSLFVPPAGPEHPCGQVVNAAPAPGGGYDSLAVIQESFADEEKMRENLHLALPGGNTLKVLRIQAVDA